MKIFALLATCLLAGCTTTHRARNFNNLPGADGKPVQHINTSNLALYALFTVPIAGDAELDTVVGNLTEEANLDGAKKIRIVQSHRHVYWWVLPPISFVIQPVHANVAGDAEY